MSKRAEEAAWKWATEKKLDPYSMGHAYGEGYEQAEKDTIERACKWIESLDDGDRIVDVKAFVNAFRNEMEE